MKRGLFALCVLTMLVASGFVRQPKAADAPLFEAGSTYAFAWDCVPLWVPELASAMIAGGIPLSPCYSERLTVLTIRKDGWLHVKDTADGNEWMVNPARATAIKKMEPPKPARVPTGVRVAR